MEMTELTPAPSRVKPAMVVPFAGIVGILIFSILQHPTGHVAMTVVGIVAAGAVCKLWLLTRRDPAWLALALMLVQLVEGFSLWSDRMRPVVMYGLTLVFCAPSLPVLWRAWKTSNSGFRLYLVFFAWCLFTVTYSVAPTFSAVRIVRSILLFAAITLCSLQVRKTDEIAPIIRKIMLAGIAVSVLTAIAAVVPNGFSWRSDTGMSEYGDEPMTRFVGLFMEPNQVGELVLVTIGIILTYFEFASLKERIALGSFAVVTLALTIMADSRSDCVALAVGSMLYVCWRYRLRGVVAIGVLSVVAVLGLTITTGDAAHYIWRGDVRTLTGRTDIWSFTMGQIAARPFTGYGYQTAGAIFASRYFPLWWGPWDEGPRSSIHNGYLSSMAGIGIPATVLWLFIVLRPWVGIFRETDDPWRLKRLLFFVVIPMLVMNMDESMIDDCASASGFLFTIVWAVAEQYRLAANRRTATARRAELLSLPPSVAGLLSH